MVTAEEHLTMALRPGIAIRRLPLLRHFAHPYMAVCIACTVVLTVTEFAFASGHSITHILAVCVALTATVGLYRYPASCASIIVGVSAVTVLMPQLSFSPQLWPHWLAYGIIMYRRRHAASALLLTVDCCVFLLARVTHVPVWPLVGIITLVSTYVVAGLVGFALAEHQHSHMVEEELRRSRRLEEEHDRMLQHVVLASKLHDSTARGLTLIALTADECLQRDASKTEYRDCLHAVKATAMSTHAEVRHIIDILQSVDQPGGAANRDHGGSFADILRMRLNENDRVLDSMGFHGNSYLDSTAESANLCPDPLIAEEIYDVIDQMYTNIVAHARSGDDAYVVRIGITGTAVTIVQFNETSTGVDSRRRPAHGLRLHKQRIRSFGGTLEYAMDDNVWSLRIQVPVRQTEPSGCDALSGF